MNLPQFQDDSQPFQLMQNKWASILNPIIANPVNNTRILKDVKLVSGLNSIPHLLQKNLQGWFIIGIDSYSTIYDQQKNNQTPNLTLKLISSSACVVQLAVF